MFRAAVAAEQVFQYRRSLKTLKKKTLKKPQAALKSV